MSESTELKKTADGKTVPEDPINRSEEEDEDEGSDEEDEHDGGGMKNAYSFSDLLGELDGEDAAAAGRTDECHKDEDAVQAAAAESKESNTVAETLTSLENSERDTHKTGSEELVHTGKPDSMKHECDIESGRGPTSKSTDLSKDKQSCTDDSETDVITNSERNGSPMEAPQGAKKTQLLPSVANDTKDLPQTKDVVTEGENEQKSKQITSDDIQEDDVYGDAGTIRQRKRDSRIATDKSSQHAQESVDNTGTNNEETNGCQDAETAATEQSCDPDNATISGTAEHTYYNEPVPTGSDGQLQSGNDTNEPVYDDVHEGKQTTVEAPAEAEAIYENVKRRRKTGTLTGTLTSNEDEEGWGSSEFESYEDSEASRSSEAVGTCGEEQSPPGLPPPRKSSKAKRTRSNVSSDSQVPMTAATMFDKITSRLSARKKSSAVEGEEDGEGADMMDVFLDMGKHPPAQLPPLPPGLDTLQTKRRHIVSTIVESECSYTSSLRRLVEDYEKPLLEIKPQIVSSSNVKVMFYKVKDILQCHNMFQIELTEYVRLWDTEERIGNVFTASFSKALVFDAYSGFVNNFSVGMETAKKQARTKQAFADFLKQRLEQSPDKLSLFGLMVKPVQRFPQFIMLLQDLLKYTPKDHHDRLALQMALTELENLTHKLNETKRESESRHDVKKIMHHLLGRHSLKTNSSRYLVRRDDVIQIEQIGGVIKNKGRRLFLLNDVFLCTTVQYKETESGMQERYKFKWSVPVQDVEVVEPSTDSPYKVDTGQGPTAKKHELPVQPLPDDHPYKKEVDNMLHDLPLVEQIGHLVAELKLKYEGLNSGQMRNINKSLRLLIQQKSDLDRCIIRLSLPLKYVQKSTDKLKDEVSKQVSKHMKGVKGSSLQSITRGSSSNRVVCTFQVDAAGIKQDWLMELHNAKLALDPRNKPGWFIPESQSQFLSKLPLFIRALPINACHDNKVRKSRTKSKIWMHCAVPILLPSPKQLGAAIQHLWVCSGDRGGQVTVVSLQGNQPHAVESFIACDSVVACAETVPGHATCDHRHAFYDSTVWMATEDCRILVLGAAEEKRSEDPKVTVTLPSMAVCMMHQESFVYVGLFNGTVLIYCQDQEGVWGFDEPRSVALGTSQVTCLMPLGRNMWAACGGTIHILRVVMHVTTGVCTPDVKHTQHQLALPEEGCIENVVNAGVGVIVSLRGKATLRLYHMETLEQLQEVSLNKAVNGVLEGKALSTELKESLKRICITCMLASKGLLWVGTNVGCILTLPLPRLEGVPQIKGRPNVAFHAHTGPIKFLSALHSGETPLPPAMTPSSSECPSSSESGGQVAPLPAVEVDAYYDEGVAEVFAESGAGRARAATEVASDPEATHPVFSQSADHERLCVGENQARSKWISTPDLRMAQAEHMEDELHQLYGSLLRGMDDDFDSELEGPRAKRRFRTTSAFSNLGAVHSKMSKAMNKMINSSDSAKYATLPVHIEESTSPPGGGLPSMHHQHSHDPSLVDTCSSSETPDSASLDTPSSSATGGGGGSGGNDPTVVPSQPSPAFPGLTWTTFTKSMVVVSGGEGHINWNQKKASETKYEDICLLLWQCRL